MQQASPLLIERKKTAEKPNHEMQGINHVSVKYLSVLETSSISFLEPQNYRRILILFVYFSGSVIIKIK